MKPAIRVNKISKQYRLGLTPNKDNNLSENLRLKARHTWDKVHRLLHPHKEHHEDESFWALKDVSLEIQPGEVVGIIGRNGAGKSTLLKILCQIVEPTSGYAEVRGRMGSLLEVGTGFHPELTGRENIYLNGSILGMSKKEIDKKFNEIVAFSEIEKFLDTPVKRYSSGMYVRLAFAVAAHLEPEILVVDEVLAVGDAAFQQKCLGKMREVRSSGRTVVIVSHQFAIIQQLCSCAIWLSHGKLMNYGSTKEVINSYLKSVESSIVARTSLKDHRGRRAKSECMMDSISLRSQGVDTAVIPIGEELEIRLQFASSRPLIRPTLGITLKDPFGQPLIPVDNKFLPSNCLDEPMERGVIKCQFTNMPLLPGKYTLDLAFGDNMRVYDIIHDAITFEVTDSDYFGTGKLPPPGQGWIAMRPKWSILHCNATET